MRVDLPGRGLHLEAELHGDAAGPPVLMLMGLGLQLIAWPEAMLRALVEAGYRVVVFDHRDCGLSGTVRAPDATPPARALGAYLLRLPFRAAYALDDMADDALALADTLGLARFHLVGVSMGGMIGQQLAARAPDRVLSLASIMSSAGPATAPWPAPSVLWRFLKPPPGAADHVARVRYLERLLAAIGRIEDASDLADLRRRADCAVRRAWRPGGVARQLCAVLSERDRSASVARIQVPTLIVHGSDDPLVRPAAALHMKRLLPRARLTWVHGMAHYLPERHLPALNAAILEHLREVQSEG
jgi:pimeloyl-ACP methyl ester carboxylesterase